MIIHQDWLVRNSQRKYPLDDSATAMSDSGVLLPEDFVVDLNIWVPAYMFPAVPYKGIPARMLEYMYISSVTVTEHLVSLTLLGSSIPAMPESGVRPEESEVFTPVAVLSLPRPIVQYKNYALSPLMPGVSGWVAFGLSATDQRLFQLSFSKPSSTLLCPKAVRTYDDRPVFDVGTVDGFSVVRGDVKLEGLEPLTVGIKMVQVGGTPRRAIVFDLVQDPEVLREFAGECGGVPESGTCNKQPILSLGGVTPDCDGFITVEVDGLDVRWLDDGLCLDSDVNIDDVCGQDDGLPYPDGTFKNETVYDRPCDTTLPYSMTPSDEVLESSFIPQKGSWYFDDATGNIVGIPRLTGSTVRTCISCYKPAVKERRFSLVMTTHGSNCEGGLTLMEQGLRRINITSTGDVFKRSRSGEELKIMSGANLNLITLTANESGLGTLKAGSQTYVFAADDPYWQPSGTCGVYTSGDPYEDSAYVEITSFSVSEVPL